MGGTVGKAEMTAGTINGNRESSFGVDLSATGLSGDIGLSAGTQGSGNYAGVDAVGTIGSAEAKAGSQIINDEVEHQYGFKTELGAEAAIAKGDINLAAESKFLKTKATISGSAGSVGASGSAGVVYDTDDILLKIALTGEVAALLGIGGDVEVEIGPFAPLLTSLFGVGSGTVISGFGTVIIGGWHALREITQNCIWCNLFYIFFFYQFWNPGIEKCVSLTGGVFIYFAIFSLIELIADNISSFHQRNNQKGIKKQPVKYFIENKNDVVYAYKVVFNVGYIIIFFLVFKSEGLWKCKTVIIFFSRKNHVQIQLSKRAFLALSLYIYKLKEFTL